MELLSVEKTLMLGGLKAEEKGMTEQMRWLDGRHNYGVGFDKF